MLLYVIFFHHLIVVVSPPSLGSIHLVRFILVLPLLQRLIHEQSRLLEITLTLLNWEYLYHLTVTNYGKPPDLDRTPWTINIHTLFVGLSGSLVQVGCYCLPPFKLALLTRLALKSTRCISRTGFVLCPGHSSSQ